MPGVGAAIIWAGINVAGTIAATIGWNATVFLGKLAASIAISALLAPDTPNVKAQASKFRTSIREATANRRTIYGTALTSGVIAFARTHGNHKRKLSIVMAICDHEVESLGNYFFNNESPWKDDIQGEVVTDGDGNKSIVGGVIKNRYKRKSNLPVFTLVQRLGAKDQPVVDELKADFPDDWTDAHQLKGVTYQYWMLATDRIRKRFPTGIPTITVEVQGKKVYDPRLDSSVDGGTGPQRVNDETTWAWSDNWALCVYDYLRDPIVGLGAKPSEIDRDTVISSANTSDEMIATPDGMQARYTMNGVVDSGTGPRGIMETMAAAAGGAIIWTEGTYKVLAGKYEAATQSIDEDDLAGGITIRPSTPRKELFNGVKGVYVSAKHRYVATDFPPVTNVIYAAEDGAQILTDLQLNYTTDVYAAQRLAKIHLERARQDIVCELMCKMTVAKIAVWDTVAVTIDRLGWAGKEFRCIAWAMQPDGRVALSLREESPTAFDWNQGEATIVDPAPNTNLDDPFDIDPPSGLTLTEDTYVSIASGGVHSRLTVTWDAEPVDEDGGETTAVEFHELRYKLSTDTEWIVLPRVVATEIIINDTVPGVYDFELYAINVLGVLSEPAVTSFELLGLLAIPTEPQNLTIASIGGLAILRWTLSEDVDVRVGGRFVFRHSNLQTGAVWTAATRIGEALSGTDTVAVLPLVAGTYLVKAVDSSGIYSTVAASASTDGATILAYSSVGTVSEHTTFSGTHSNTISSASKLKLDSAGDMNGWADVDLVADWDNEGGIYSSGTYDFAGGIDLTTTQPCRLVATVSATVTNIKDQIDDRASLINTWEDFDGDNAGDAADVEIWVRHTDDDPTGSPTWSDYQRFNVAEFNKRAFEFQARLMTADTAYNIEIDTLTVDAEGI